MSLTLDDLKSIRFPIAKRPNEGYRAVEVDAFLDRVDESFTELMDENTRLKAQLDSLDPSQERSEAGADADSELAAENQQLKQQLEELKAQQADQASQQSEPAEQPNTKELDRLRTENASLREQLTQAQQPVAEGEAAPQRLVVTSAAEASPAVTRLVQLATEQADSVVAEANAHAEKVRGEAQAEADRLRGEAQTHSERVRGEAQSHADQVRAEAESHAAQTRNEAQAQADRLQSEAQANFDRVNAEADERRHSLFSDLEKERDVLKGRVDHLRNFEASYRNNLSNHLQWLLDTVRNSSHEPKDTPDLMRQENQEASKTPRLDALLAEGEQKG